VVPTWNYVAIHVYGPVRFFDDADRRYAHVTKRPARQEVRRAAPWAVTDAPEEYIRGQLKRIIGFEIPIARIEGKWKMSQNRPAQDRIGVVEGLVREGGPAEAVVAKIVAAVHKD
jgi:transcriptional regulator